MSTVRCPNCKRALHLPETREVASAQCPLCQATFEPPPGVVPTLASIPVPAVKIAPLPAEAEEFPSLPDAPQDSGESYEHWASRRAINSAAQWLRVSSVISLIQLVMCGCCDLLDSSWADHRNMELVAMLWLVRLACIIVIWSSAESFQRRRGLSYVYVGATLAFLLGLYMLFRSRVAVLPLVELILGGTSQGPAIYIFYGVFQAIVGGGLLVGAIKTLLLANRPDIRASFQR